MKEFKKSNFDRDYTMYGKEDLTREDIKAAKFLKAKVRPKSWIYTEINGEEADKTGKNVPCKKGNCWEPLIDIDKGVIVNWKRGVEAEIRLEVYDQEYTFMNDKYDNILKVEVEDTLLIMQPYDVEHESGADNHVMMDVDKKGKIKFWTKILDDIFEDFD